jgi:hypothetical protein
MTLLVRWRYLPMNKLFILLSVLLVVGCKKEQIIPEIHIPVPLFSKDQTFRISKGDHFSTPKLEATFAPRQNRIDVIVNFSEETRPVSLQDEKDNYGHVNKLIGFSDCYGHHNAGDNANSARLGWRYNDRELYIVPYMYINGVRTYDTNVANALAKIDTERDYKMYVAIKGGMYEFGIQVDGEWKTQSWPRGCNENVHGKYLLRPYFGGNPRAPRTMDIRIQFLDRELN